MEIFDNIKQIKGIGDKTALLFNKVGVYSISDLLKYYPRTYVAYQNPKNLSEYEDKDIVCVRLSITEDFKWKKTNRYVLGTGFAYDGKDRVCITYFNTPYYKSKLIKGSTYIFCGRLIVTEGRYKLEQPEFYTFDQYNTLKESLQPIYSLTKGLSNKIVSKTIKSCVYEGEYPNLYNEYLSTDAVEEFRLMSRKDALISIHFPQNEDKLKEARKRLSFDELFAFLLMLRTFKTSGAIQETDYKMIMTAECTRFIEQLPYSLTDAQKRVIDEINEDLCSGYAMNRLVQGDVGSGKTIVAFIALLLCVSNGYQAALMAPTEILATQHYSNFIRFINDYDLPIKAALLTGSVSAKNKEAIANDVKDGKINLLIGTHAVIEDYVQFKNLSLVVTDEQHRFGVKQRQRLTDKGDGVHVLVMSATPIPRTLAIVLYGDMHLSIIDEKPSNRLPIKNCVVNTSYRPKAYEFIAKQISEGHQAYIICPMVEESEGLNDVENVIEYTEKIKKVLPLSIRTEYLHGKMRAADKNNIMSRFASGDIDILVSTTVVEVGVDVPNATVMMVENAERFGLSQLHQLRGRIGRGDSQSYSIFINGTKNDIKRLDILNKSNDGFYIAKEDLRLRGEGDIFGIRQSGDNGFEIADIYEDSEMIIQISEYIDNLLKEDPDLSSDKNKGINDYLSENMNKFIDFKTI